LFTSETKADKSGQKVLLRILRKHLKSW